MDTETTTTTTEPDATATCTAPSPIPPTCRPVGPLVVRVSAAAMPHSCWGRYYHVGVLELTHEGAPFPHEISTRPKGVHQVLRVWRKLSGRGGDRTARARAECEADALIARLSARCA